MDSARHDGNGAGRWFGRRGKAREMHGPTAAGQFRYPLVGAAPPVVLDGWPNMT